jgi:hypothetical protein
MDDPDRWCTATFDKLNYSPFLRARMKQDPSYGLARDIVVEMRRLQPGCRYIHEYACALARVSGLAEADRSMLMTVNNGERFWGSEDTTRCPLPRGMLWQQIPARPGYQRIDKAMRNDRPSYALALRLLSTHGEGYPLQCVATVAGIEEFNRAQFRQEQNQQF